MQEFVELEFLAEAFRCHVHHYQCLTVHRESQALKMSTWYRKASAKNSSTLNKFLHNEVNLLIQQIIVKGQDEQNNNVQFNKNIINLIKLLVPVTNFELLRVHRDLKHIHNLNN